MHNHTLHRIILTAGLCYTAAASAQDADEHRWVPEWGMELTSELQFNPGAEGDEAHKFNYVNLLRLNASLPIAHGVSVELGSLSTAMTSGESIGVERQTCSNLDAGNVLFALSMAGINWDFTSPRRARATGSRVQRGRHSLFVGIRNMNEDYFASDVTAFFSQSTCGIFPTISCNYDVANYPCASVGAHYRVVKEMGRKKKSDGFREKADRFREEAGDDAADAFIFQASLYNGLGYSRFTGRENVFRFCPKDDGIFGLTELSYIRKGSQYFAGSSIYYNKGVTERTLGFTPWIYAEQRLSDNVSLLAGVSHTFDESAECTDFAGLGVHYALPHSGRLHQPVELGLFTDYARFSLTPLPGSDDDRTSGAEWATELSCKLHLSQHIFLQPAFHFVATPSATSGTTCQTLALLRVGIEL